MLSGAIDTTGNLLAGEHTVVTKQEHRQPDHRRLPATTDGSIRKITRCYFVKDEEHELGHAAIVPPAMDEQQIVQEPKLRMRRALRSRANHRVTCAMAKSATCEAAVPSSPVMPTPTFAWRHKQ